MLVNIYCNLRALSPSAEAVSQTSMLGPFDSTFPHPDRDWQPFSNWLDSDRTWSDSMFGNDEIDNAEADSGADAEQWYDEDNEVADDWRPDAQYLFRPCPLEPLRSIKVGDEIVVWFGGGVQGVVHRQGHAHPSAEAAAGHCHV